MDCESELKDNSDLIPQSFKNDELSLRSDLYVKDEDQNDCMLRALFDQVLNFFLKEVSVNKNDFRPFPPKLGDGQEADLFKLFLCVRRIGNYESVSENDMWEFVAKECGLEIEVVSSLKLIFVKYLKEFDQWLIEGGSKDEKMENVDVNEDKVVYHNVKSVEKVISSQKRKREESSPLSEMLDWIANAARNPHDIAFGKSRRSSKWKNYTNDKLWKQTLLTKQALFAQLTTNTGNGASSSQKDQRMHPSTYEDDKVTSRTKRCSRRATSAEQCSCPNCILRTSSRSKRQKTQPRNITTDRICEITEPHDQDYNLGSLYQAEVPAFTGPIYDSDPKWLGTQMWPPPDNHKEDIDTVGLGRETTCKCECLFPGSAECVRFHIAENRLKIKIELGPLFYKWDFNQMGEEVSLPWEPEEEDRFKTLVVKARQDLDHSNKSRREIMSKFWRRASESIPAKPKRKLVSYYFNVFVLRRRSYQNRVTPGEIDSDNDEEEVGIVGDRFGYEKIHGLSLKCSENMQCTELNS